MIFWSFTLPPLGNFCRIVLTTTKWFTLSNCFEISIPDVRAACASLTIRLLSWYDHIHHIFCELPRVDWQYESWNKMYDYFICFLSKISARCIQWKWFTMKKNCSAKVSSDVDLHWSHTDPDPKILMNANLDPDPGQYNHRIDFKPSFKVKKTNTSTL